MTSESLARRADAARGTPSPDEKGPWRPVGARNRFRLDSQSSRHRGNAPENLLVDLSHERSEGFLWRVLPLAALKLSSVEGSKVSLWFYCFD
ncbi:uncharacterized protein THITE_2109936 [Thermothielavioides terrestris NRRL 8126]|uniref:Uncharacterized protein n=1 Tax=Thermothielavioides terrestris (strain ATCC 38088 / NRRL 8126) TaxID=578455 RepID=G2QQW1_THETT|nr:uncharacterized protein THITE_2109936 [Thermothielavioides terrestris NRRL 8126]AEO64120.1 hypothetical protein THITE_2109936 [Thermothielavioides terrestris NRRL 8126]